MANLAGDDQVIARCANRLKTLAAYLLRAHELGVEPGDENEPWSRAFQRSALPIYRMTLPPLYLAEMAINFSSAVDLMRAAARPPALDADWHIVEIYFGSVAAAIHEDRHPLPHAPRPGDLASIEPTPPVLLRFDELANRISTDGATRLHRAAERVAEHCSRPQLPVSEEDLVFLRGLAAGDSIDALAESHGISRRSMYRRSRHLWNRLGVDDRHQALVLAAREGWI